VKILLTGGTGFIGSNIAKALIDERHTVAVITRKRAVSNSSSFYVPGVKYFTCDLIDVKTLEEIFKIFNPEIVNHHAGTVGIKQSVNNVVLDAEDNIIDSINLFDLSVKYNVKRIIFASTSAVYGKPKVLPVSEDICLEPEMPYGISKLCSEEYLNFYRKMYGVERVILRYGNVYGKIAHGSSGFASVLDLFFKKAYEGESLVLNGDGKETRDFVYIKDVVNANILAIKGKEGIYNVGTGVETSLISLIEIISTVLGKKISYKNDFSKIADTRRFVLDISRARRNLGFIPKYLPVDGMREMISIYGGKR